MEERLREELTILDQEMASKQCLTKLEWIGSKRQVEVFIVHDFGQFSGGDRCEFGTGQGGKGRDGWGMVEVAREL